MPTAELLAGRSLAELTRYVIVGLISFLLFLSVSYGLVIAGAPLGIATAISILAAGVANFLLHRSYTFQSTKLVSQSLPRYVALTVSNCVLGAVFVSLAVSWGMAILAANLLCAIGITAISFVAMKLKVM